MKDLRIDENTTLITPDADSAVEIVMWTEESGNNSVWVSFYKLERWVASIRGQIITSSNKQAKQCKYDKNYARQESSGCSSDCDDYPPVS